MTDRLTDEQVDAIAACGMLPGSIPDKTWRLVRLEHVKALAAEVQQARAEAKRLRDMTALCPVFPPTPRPSTGQAHD